MKKIVPSLFLTLILTACQQAAVVAEPTFISELSPYYGNPEPARILLDGETYNAEIGNFQWITEVYPDGTTTTLIGDAFAINTPKEPVIVNRDLAMVLELPIPIKPTELWYRVYKISQDELRVQDVTQDVFRWNPDSETQLYIENTVPLLSAAQHLNFSLELGIYVFQVHAAWGGKPPHTELEAEYGFLLDVQE